MGCFLVLWKLLFVSFCVVVWVLFSGFSIFCIMSLVSATPRNHPKMINCDALLAQMEHCRSNVIVSVHLNDALSGSYAAGCHYDFKLPD